MIDLSNRMYNNLIAIIVVIAILSIILALTSGCSSITMVSGAKGTDSYQKVSFRGPPKDFKALDFKFGDDTRLKAGTAATSEQPWAKVASDYGQLLFNMQAVVAYCEANPAECINGN